MNKDGDNQCDAKLDIDQMDDDYNTLRNDGSFG